MRVYVGQTRSAALARELVRAGIGECTVRGELDPRRRPFFHDNGAWRDFAAGRAFDCTRWVRDMWMAREHLVPFLDAVLAGDDGAALARAA